MIRVVLPAHLRTLARVNGEVVLDVMGMVTQRSVLDALEARYPMLHGTIREHGTVKRRAFSDSSLASRISRMTHRILRFPMQSQQVLSRF